MLSEDEVFPLSPEEIESIRYDCLNNLPEVHYSHLIGKFSQYSHAVNTLLFLMYNDVSVDLVRAFFCGVVRERLPDPNYDWNKAIEDSFDNHVFDCYYSRKTFINLAKREVIRHRYLPLHCYVESSGGPTEPSCNVDPPVIVARLYIIYDKDGETNVVPWSERKPICDGYLVVTGYIYQSDGTVLDMNITVEKGILISYSATHDVHFAEGEDEIVFVLTAENCAGTDSKRFTFCREVIPPQDDQWASDYRTRMSIYGYESTFSYCESGVVSVDAFPVVDICGVSRSGENSTTTWTIKACDEDTWYNLSDGSALPPYLNSVNFEIAPPELMVNTDQQSKMTLWFKDDCDFMKKYLIKRSHRYCDGFDNSLDTYIYKAIYNGYVHGGLRPVYWEKEIFNSWNETRPVYNADGTLKLTFETDMSEGFVTERLINEKKSYNSDGIFEEYVGTFFLNPDLDFYFLPVIFSRMSRMVMC